MNDPSTPHDPRHPTSERVATIRIDGRSRPLGAAPPHRTLLRQLRALGLSGTKEGCAEGDCGACTVALRDAEGAPWRAVNSCLLPLAACAGREVRTVEGVEHGEGDLHPVQRSLVEHGGSQCGYCTPGFVMSLWVAFENGELGDRVRVDRAIEGNLCRCTGYLPIRRAALELGRGASAAPLRDAAPAAPSPPGISPVDHAASGARFVRPERLERALELLANEGAVAVAGATDLGVEIAKHGRRAPLWVSLEALPELQLLEVGEDAVTIGAGVPLARVERELAGVSPALDAMLRWFAARQIRNRATLGGNLGTASPIGDLAPVLLALDAELELVALAPDAGGVATRRLPLDGFFRGYRDTALAPGELIATARWSRRPAAGAARRLEHAAKVGKRGTDDISIVAAAFVLDVAADDTVVQARLAYGGVAATPLRALDVEAWLEGRPWNGATAERAAALLEDAFTPLDDHRGSADYRRRLCGNLLRRFAAETRTERGEAA